MAKQNLSSAPTPATIDPATIAAIVAAISAEKVRLHNLRRSTVARILALETQKVIAAPPPEQPTVRERALALINGLGRAADAAHPSGAPAELFQLRADIAAIDDAVQLLEQRELAERAAHVAALIPELEPTWREATRELAVALIALQRAQDAREKIKQKFVVAGGVPNLALVTFNLSGSLFDRDQRARFLGGCVAAGIITKREIENA